ncbi:succinylglutamate desuccinylase/aspartoacylase family protein [Oscillatoria sp. CS-180]|uniref:succinylglutamate desuccinylase/aspartoacylase domain-containing protein n=1 Tax=Oscillatoria sp. CS-180 TaxID=3021720 RepID=UPI00232DB06C|nr:succinylglutamate desuccinylase/aspartoacylase family protein [Oscillatoria sp. CS-180]MDB9525378.1 succinylglutamate desuccinylase/aspartoacylase family protein [Oscillatoria sp. CS-180]
MNPDVTVVPLLELASGDSLSLQVYRFVGSQPGKIVYVQSNLHGAELAGNVVIHRLLSYLTALDQTHLRGEIRLVPVCNPIGVNTRAHHFASGRFNPYDGQDWNRIFWDYEQVHKGARSLAERHLGSSVETIQRAYRQAILQSFQVELDALQSPVGVPLHQRYRTRLQQQALDADMVIDLHTSANQGMVYTYYFRDRESSIPYFDLDFAIQLDKFDGNAFDETFINPWLALETAFADMGRSLQFDVEAWTLELGSSMAINSVAVERGLRGILNYLRYRKVLVDRVPEFCKPVPLSRSSRLTKYFATRGGFIQNRVQPGTRIQPGDWLYSLLRLRKTGAMPVEETICAQQAGLVYDVGWNQAVSEGEYVLAVMDPDRHGVS